MYYTCMIDIHFLHMTTWMHIALWVLFTHSHFTWFPEVHWSPWKTPRLMPFTNQHLHSIRSQTMWQLYCVSIDGLEHQPLDDGLHCNYIPVDLIICQSLPIHCQSFLYNSTWWNKLEVLRLQHSRDMKLGRVVIFATAKSGNFCTPPFSARAGSPTTRPL